MKNLDKITKEDERTFLSNEELTELSKTRKAKKQAGRDLLASGLGWMSSILGLATSTTIIDEMTNHEYLPELLFYGLGFYVLSNACYFITDQVHAKRYQDESNKEEIFRERINQRKWLLD